ncbi:hypothetical protein LJB42_004130 [Komagataella kurtzmanii]|nr:hypothetical protein LJB42_004130 [Komagataella kurtzmanii]
MAEQEAIFRSAEMSLIQLYIPTDISREAIFTLGNLGVVQFRDLNKSVNAFQRFFIDEIKKLDNVDRQHRFFQSLLDENLIESKADPYSDETFNYTTILSKDRIDDLTEGAQFLEERLSQLVESQQDLQKKKMELQQMQHVLKASDGFFLVSGTQDSFGELQPDSFLENGGLADVSYVTGVINREKYSVLQQILWRSLRGNLYMNFEEIEEPIYDTNSKKFVDKNAFIIYAHGEVILSRIRKIAESLDADLYFVEQERAQRTKQYGKVHERLADIATVLSTIERALFAELTIISRELHGWSNAIRIEKSVYHVMNTCHNDLQRKCLIAEGWVPTFDLEKVQDSLERISNSSPADDPVQYSIPIIVNTLSTTKIPPTYHKTNKFTAAFQSMCDAYGVASYREINAALPTSATFPFMFAIMFGDLGHGLLMFLAAATLVLNEKKIARIKRDEIFDMAYVGRYILLLMGLFSMYTGFLYNDIFSISMTWFKSGWSWPSRWNEGDSIEGRQTGVYPIGLDPAWHGAENALLFSNSYKMKLSILMGFIHMTYSYIFSLVNYLHFQSVVDIIGNFIPGLLFMQGIFGYLSICIVYKWTVDWIAIEKPAPSLLNMLISMFLSPGNVTEELYPNQASVQVILLLVALVCVPWLLLFKPLHFKFTHKQKYEHLPSSDEPSDEEANNFLSSLNIQDDEEHEEHEFGDIMIHQVIHTIEFCLNCVSHTASYLRLWALSLAHAQLSSVLWSMTIGSAFGMTGLLGIIFTFIMFGMWFVLTVCILVVMEGTSAMLHSLRLHWVESMSKFFEGEGTPYRPFAFKSVLLDDEE